MKIEIEISAGELLDRYSILMIKIRKITNKYKLDIVKEEKKKLDLYVSNMNLEILKFDKLIEVNQILWDLEDKITEKEKNNHFDEEFVQIARNIYIHNDRRYKLKNDINNTLKSNLFEVKNHL